LPNDKTKSKVISYANSDTNLMFKKNRVLIAAQESTPEVFKKIFNDLPEHIKSNTLLSCDVFNRNTLHYAATNQNPGMIRTLYSMMPKETFINLLGSPDDTGETPMHEAAQNKNKEIYSFIKRNISEKKFEMLNNIRDSEMITPSMLVTKNKRSLSIVTDSGSEASSHKRARYSDNESNSTISPDNIKKSKTETNYRA